MGLFDFIVVVRVISAAVVVIAGVVVAAAVAVIVVAAVIIGLIANIAGCPRIISILCIVTEGNFGKLWYQFVVVVQQPCFLIVVGGIIAHGLIGTEGGGWNGSIIVVIIAFGSIVGGAAVGRACEEVGGEVGGEEIIVVIVIGATVPAVTALRWLFYGRDPPFYVGEEWLSFAF